MYGGPGGAIAQLEALESWFAVQRDFRFYSSSGGPACRQPARRRACAGLERCCNKSAGKRGRASLCILLVLERKDFPGSLVRNRT